LADAMGAKKVSVPQWWLDQQHQGETVTNTLTLLSNIHSIIESHVKW